jgi:hypothetical protein
MRNGAIVLLKSKNVVKENPTEMYVYGKLFIKRTLRKFNEVVICHQMGKKRF